MSVLDPLSHALAAVIAAAHAALTALGSDPGAASTWVLCIAALVGLVRLALLPVVAHGVRQAHAASRARPRLQALTRRYRDTKDPESLRRFLEERRAIAREHRLSRWGCLPLLLQLPLWISLYHLLDLVASGVAVGAMDADLVASLGAATLLGVPLAGRGYLGGGSAHLAVVAGLAVLAAGLSYLTQRYLVAPTTVVSDEVPAAVHTAQQWLPAVSAAGLLVAAGAVPAALLVYWVCNSTWTLVQSAVVWRWFPTPGSPAALRR